MNDILEFHAYGTGGHQTHRCPIDKCPHCGSDEGFYNNFRVSGWSRYKYRFDGEDAYNGDMWDHINSKDSKKAYCCKCEKEIKELYGFSFNQ